MEEYELITAKDKALARGCLNFAKDAGASDSRVTLINEVSNLVGTRDGQIDKVTASYDRSLYITLICGKRHGSFSTNNLNEESLRDFIGKAVKSVQMLAEEPCFTLPDRNRICKDAITGDEMAISDRAIASVSPEERIKIALGASLGSTLVKARGCKVVSEECEYTDIWSGVYKVDSQGLEASHYDTSFEYSAEVTVQDSDGERYSGFWWDSAPFLKDFDPSHVGEKALRMAEAQMNPREVDSFKGNMVVDPECSSHLVTPVLDALSGRFVQQHNSFLEGKLAQKVFGESFSLVDRPCEKGHFGSKIFDSEGVSRSDADIISKGVVNEYSLNTFYAAKLQMEPTRDEITVPKVLPWPRPGLNLESIMKMCGSGILVTGFNGGNYDYVTGDFSYGIEGFAFEGGKISHPIREMLITGNYITLWNNLIAAGCDPRPCSEKMIPTLAFKDVNFNA